MSSQLVVTQPFGDYARGDLITDTAKMHEVSKSHPGHFHKIAVEEPEAPEKPADKKADDKPKTPVAPDGPAPASPKA